MAFRGYELNLFLRVQDRGAARLRRLAGDLGGINRAAQMQRDITRLARGPRGITQEQEIARARLLGLNQAKLAAEQLSVNLERATAAGRLTAEEANRVAAAYERAATASRLAQRGRTISHIGSVAALTGGVGVVALGGAASSFAAFNRETVRTATQIRGIGEGFHSVTRISKVLGTEILDLTRRFPASAAEMAQSAYEIASGMNLVTASGKNAVTTQERFNATSRLLVAANQASMAGFVDLGAVTNAMITVFNNFDPAVQHQNKILNTLFATVQYGKGTFEDFTPVFGKISASAKAAGQTLTEAGGAVAFLSQRLGSTANAATAYVRLIQIIGRKEFRVGFQSLFGISATTGGPGEPLKQLSTLINIMVNRRSELGPLKGTTLLNLLQNITARGQDIITGKPGHTGILSTQNARVGIFNLIGGWKDYITTLNNVKSNTDAFSTSLKAAAESPGVKWQIAINQFKAFAIIIGQSVLPVLLRFMQSIGNLAHHFENLSPGIRHAIGSFAAWGSILLLIGGTISILAGSMISFAARLLEIGGKSRIASEELGVAGGSGLIGKLGKLSFLLRGIAAIGVLSVVFNMVKGGGNWGTLGKLLLSVLAGWKVGGPAGAIIIPVTLMVTNQGFRDSLQKMVESIPGVKWLDKVAKYSPGTGTLDQIMQARKDAAKKAQAAKVAAAFITATTKGVNKYIADQMKKNPLVMPPFAVKYPAQDTTIVRQKRTSLLNKLTGSFVHLSQKETFVPTLASLFKPSVLPGMDREVARVQALEKRVQVAFIKLNRDTIGVFQSGRLIEQFRRGSLGFDILSQGAVKLTNQNTRTAKTFLQTWRDTASELSGLGIYQALTEQAAQAVSQLEVNLSKAQSQGNVPAIKAAADALIKQDNTLLSQAKKQKNLSDTLKYQKQLYDDITSKRSIIDGYNKKDQVASDRALRAQEAANTKLSNAKARVEELRLKFQQLRENELNKLQAAFGQIGQGPLMQGPIGQIFTQISSTLAGFGKTFAIPISFTLQDQAAQQRNFDQLNKDIGILFKHGAPRKAIEDFLQQGTTPTNLSILAGVIQSGPAGMKKFIDGLKKGQASITAATKTPWERQIQAADLQYKAAVLQMKIATGKLTKADEAAAKAQLKALQGAAKNAKPSATTPHHTPPKPAPVRTVAMVNNYHGDEVHVHPGVDTSVAGYFRKRDWERRTRYKNFT